MATTDLALVAADRLPDSVAPLGSAVWAAGEAARLLSSALPKKWAHTQEVARHARWAAAGVGEGERELLVAAAYLHDIGYAEPLAVTGFHPLDGARYLAHLGLVDLACLVAHHSGAAVEAVHRGLSEELAEFPQPVGAVADALTYSDVTSGPTGRSVSPGARYAEIVQRHGPDSIVAESRTEARGLMYGSVARTLRRATAARPLTAPLAVTPVELGCSTLVRFQGVLNESTAPQALQVLRQVLKDEPHTAVCDLALLDGIDNAGAQAFLTVAGWADANTTVTFADPPPHLHQALRSHSGGEQLPVVRGIEKALTPHCI